MAGALDTLSKTLYRGFVWMWPVAISAWTNITNWFAPDSGHRGVDVGVPTGTKVLAPFSGTVKTYPSDSFDSGANGGYGQYVRVYSTSGYSVILAHLSELHVTDGDVERGQVLGLSGGGKTDAGHGNSTGPHVHIEVRDSSNTFQDPADFWSGGTSPGVPGQDNGSIPGAPGSPGTPGAPETSKGVPSSCQWYDIGCYLQVFAGSIRGGISEGVLDTLATIFGFSSSDELKKSFEVKAWKPYLVRLVIGAIGLGLVWMAVRSILAGTTTPAEIMAAFTNTQKAVNDTQKKIINAGQSLGNRKPSRKRKLSKRTAAAVDAGVSLGQEAL